MSGRNETFRHAYGMLDGPERQRAAAVLIIVMLEALTAALAVGSALPFLSVVSDPGLIETVPILSHAYAALDFTSAHDFVIALGGATCGLILLASSLQFLRSWLVLRFVTLFSRRLSERLLQTYLSQSYEFFLQAEYPVLSTHILSESQLVGNLYFRPLFEIVAGGLTIAVVAMLLFWVQPVLLIAALVGIGGLYLLMAWLSRRFVDRLADVRLRANRGLYATVHEAFAGVKYLRLTGGELRYLGRFREPANQLARAQVAASLIGEGPQHLLRAFVMVSAILACMMLLQPDKLAGGGALTAAVPVMGVFAFAAIRLLPEFAKIYRASVQMRSAGPAVNSIRADLMRPEAVKLEQLPAPLPLRKNLTLTQLSYAYPGSRLAGVEQVSLDIEHGETIGLVGKSGAGKTTLADLILGLLVPDTGDILVDGTALSNDNRRGWQRTVGYVPQDIHLADSSIAENIAFGLKSDELDLAKVRRAAQTAGIDAFVMEQLPERYATRIGERGARLSGGQRQRLGIARALYHEPEFMLFDEPTSALDKSTEVEFLQAVHALTSARSKTCLIISHRLSNLGFCNRIIVMDAGRVVGFAPWDELAAHCSAFQDMLGASQAA